MSLFILSESIRGNLLALSDSPLSQKSVISPTRLIPRDELGAPLLDPMDITVRETLLTTLEKDSLYIYWYARFSTLRWVQSAPQGLEIPLKRTGHISHLDRMEDLLVEMKKTAQQVHACFESYKTVVRTYQILDDGFAKRENQQSELWQDLLQDLFERLEDLYMLAFVFVGPKQDDSLPLEIYNNISYARSWMGIAWKELMQCHVFLKLNFFDVDGTFGKLREPAKVDLVTSSLESLTLELNVSDDSDCSVDLMDFLSSSDDEPNSTEGSTGLLRRSRSVLSRLGRMGLSRKS